MYIKNCLNLVLLFLVMTTANARTKQSQLIEYIQKKYADPFTAYPILIVDRDELELRYARAQAPGKGDEKLNKRVGIFKSYIKGKTGVELTNLEASNLEVYTSIAKEGARSIPILGKRPSKRSVYEVCVVFPASPNSNQQLETHRLLAMDTEGAYEQTNFHGLKEKLSHEELRLFSLYHELAHCLDTVITSDIYDHSIDISAYDVHLVESFAETFALLIMEQEGFHNIAIKRALYRNMYSREMGKWFADTHHTLLGTLFLSRVVPFII